MACNPADNGCISALNSRAKLLQQGALGGAFSSLSPAIKGHWRLQNHELLNDRFDPVLLIWDAWGQRPELEVKLPFEVCRKKIWRSIF